jgi:hypothetical protein
MFAPLTPGERPAVAAASNRKRKNDDWTPIPVPDDVPLPDGKIWPEVGMPFPPHSLGKPTDCLWFHNEAGQVVGGECRFEIDEPADAKGAAGANGAQASAKDFGPNGLNDLTSDAADAADAKFPHRSGAAEKRAKTYRPLVYARRDDGQAATGAGKGCRNLIRFLIGRASRQSAVGACVVGRRPGTGVAARELIEAGLN